MESYLDQSANPDEPADPAGASGVFLAGDEATQAPAPKFCTRCGAPWDPSWTSCPNCVIGPPPLPQAQPTLLTGSRHAKSVRSALALYFAMLAVSIVAVIAMVWGGSDEVPTSIWANIAYTIVVLAWMAGAFRLVRPALATLGKPKWYLIAAVSGVATFFIASWLMAAVAHLLGIETTGCSQSYLDAGYGWGVVFLVICIQPPLIEELAFRGIILPVLRDTIGLRDAVIVSSLMFMVLHLLPLAFPHLLLIGLMLGYLRVKSGSLYPCILMHFVHNTLVILTEMGGL